MNLDFWTTNVVSKISDLEMVSRQFLNMKKNYRKLTKLGRKKASLLRERPIYLDINN